MIEGKNLKLRALEPEDVNLIYKWENNTDVWRVSNTLTPFSKHIIKSYIEHSHLDIFQLKQLRLIIVLKKENQAIGIIDLFDFDPYHKRAGIGILIADKKFRNKGYAVETLEIIKNYASNILGLHQLFCNISIENTVSINLFKKLGFKVTGTKKDWEFNRKSFTDVLLLQYIF